MNNRLNLLVVKVNWSWGTKNDSFGLFGSLMMLLPGYNAYPRNILHRFPNTKHVIVEEDERCDC